MDMHSSLQLVAVEEPVTMATPVMPVTMATPVMPVSGGETERRFGKLVSDQELQRLMDDRVPPETRRKIKWAAQLFETWRSDRNAAISAEEPGTENLSVIGPTLLQMTDDELNYSMARFVQEVHKKGERVTT